MSISAPRVSLAMPVYNGENFIGQALASITSQTYEDFELIVTDNASVDATSSVVLDLAARDSRIRYVCNERNVGAAENYNRGFALARGQYLKWCAHDDLINAEHLAALVAALDADPGLSLAYGRTVSIDGDGQVIPVVGAEMPELDELDPVRRFYKSITLAGTCFPIFGLFRMDVLRRSSLHRPYYGSDRGLLAEAALLGRFRRVREASFYNREHETRSINIDDKLARSRWQNGQTSRVAAAEHLNLARHLYEIAGRHPDIASPLHARLVLSRHALHPRQVGRYALEATSIVSPKMARSIKSIMTRMLPSAGGSRQADFPGAVPAAKQRDYGR